MTHLTDTQAILLSTASRRANGSVLPLHASITLGSGTDKAISALMRRGLAEERQTSDLIAVRREYSDLRYGVFITDSGAAAIGVVGSEHDDDTTIATDPAPAANPRATKSAAVLALLRRPTGATLPELITATGWLPHTTRAALTGLRKKGHVIVRGKRDDGACYSIADATNAAA